MGFLDRLGKALSRGFKNPMKQKVDSIRKEKAATDKYWEDVHRKQYSDPAWRARGELAQSRRNAQAAAYDANKKQQRNYKGYA